MAMDIESDGDVFIVRESSKGLTATGNIRSSIITFSADRKAASVTLASAITADTSYIVTLVDDETLVNVGLAKVIAESSAAVLIKGEGAPEAELTKEENKFVITFPRKMTNGSINQYKL